MPLYRIDITETVHRRAVIEVPEGFDTRDKRRLQQLADLAEEVASDVDSNCAGVEVSRVLMPASIDARLSLDADRVE